MDELGSTGTPRYTFVLVHGGWSSSEVFAQLSDLLRQRGHRVYAPDLTGCGARSHLLQRDIRLRTHVLDVVNVMKWADLSKVILVGHSYGGMVITEVASEASELIDSIVYLDAFLPAENQAAIDLIANPAVRESLLEIKRSGAPGVPMAQRFTAAIGVPQEHLWKFTPHPTATFFDPIASASGLPKLRKRTYVWATGWPAHKDTYETLANDPSWNTVAVDAGHMIQWDQPQRCLQILEDAAT